MTYKMTAERYHASYAFLTGWYEEQDSDFPKRKKIGFWCKLVIIMWILYVKPILWLLRKNIFKGLYVNFPYVWGWGSQT